MNYRETTNGGRLLPTPVESRSVRLTIKEADWVRLRERLLQKDGLERQAFLELGMRDDQTVYDLFLHRMRPLTDEDYVFQGPYRVRPTPEAVASAYNAYRESGVPVHGHIHSHPFAEKGIFSGVDDKTRLDMAQGLSGLAGVIGMEDTALCFQMVVGQKPSGFQGVLTDLNGVILGELDAVRVVGPRGITVYGDAIRTVPRGDMIHDPRLDRNIRWLGEDGQALLANTHVAVAGLGGAGAMLVANLRGLGLNEMTLIDPDLVESSNLNRLSGAGRRDVGLAKVHVFKREILKVRPETKVNALAVGVEDPKAQAHIARADVVIAALDGMGPRAELQVLCARFLKPLFDLGSGILVDRDRTIKRMGSQIIVYVPGGPCLACQSLDLFRPDSGIAGEIRKKTGYVAGTDFTPTAVATINSVAAGWAVDLFIRYLTGMGPIPLYTEIDQWAGTVRQVFFVKKASCPVCGDGGLEGKGEDQTEPLSPPTEGLGFEILDVSKEENA